MHVSFEGWPIITIFEKQNVSLNVTDSFIVFVFDKVGFWVGHKQINSFLVKTFAKFLIKLWAKLLNIFLWLMIFSEYFECLIKSQRIAGHCPWCCSKWCFASNYGWKNFVGMILNISGAGKLDAGTSSHRQQPSQMEAFRGQACSEQSLAKKEKEKNQSDQIRAPRLFRHVPISSKLSHFLLKHSKQIHILEKKIEW